MGVCVCVQVASEEYRRVWDPSELELQGPLNSGCAEPGASILKEHEVPLTEPSPQPLVSALVMILIICF